jgi:hypothetical protein
MTACLDLALPWRLLGSVLQFPEIGLSQQLDKFALVEGPSFRIVLSVIDAPR